MSYCPACNRSDDMPVLDAVGYCRKCGDSIGVSDLHTVGDEHLCQDCASKAGHFNRPSESESD